MEQKNYDAVVEFLRDGYGERLLRVLMLCIERYMEALVSLDMCPGKWEAENMWYLCTMFKALLKDEYGIDLEK